MNPLQQRQKVIHFETWSSGQENDRFARALKTRKQIKAFTRNRARLGTQYRTNSYTYRVNEKPSPIHVSSTVSSHV